MTCSKIELDAAFHRGYVSGAASRDAEVAGLKAWNIELVRQEGILSDRCRQLREQVAMLRKILLAIYKMWPTQDSTARRIFETLAATEPK